VSLQPQTEKVPFRRSLAGRILLFGGLPSVAIMAIVTAFVTLRLVDAQRASLENTLKQVAEQVAAEIDRGNTKAVMASTIMALAQQRGMFGDRLESTAYAREVLDSFPEFTGAYFGYEPNADRDDAEYRASDEAKDIADALNEDGRFLPYWFRDILLPGDLKLSPLVDMETSLYYNGVKDLYERSGRPQWLITEPYVYEGKMIVEQVYPIVIDGKFVGVAGVDRALDDIEFKLRRISIREEIEIVLISRTGRVIAASGELIEDFSTQDLTDTPYSEVLGQLFALRGEPRLIVADDPVSGDPSFFASSPVPTGDWMVVVSRPQLDLVAPLRATVLPVIGVSLLGIAGIVLIAFLITSRAGRRIRQSVEAADLIAAGSSAASLSCDQSGGDEVSQLNRSFNRLLAGYRDMVDVCRAIAEGDYTKRVALRSEQDELAIAINEMSKKRAAAEEALKSSEERTRLVLESTNEGIFGVDLDGCISFVNEAVTQMLGFARKELMGQPAHPLIHHSYADGGHYPVEQCPMYKAFTDGVPSTVTDEVMWRKDGSSVEVEYSAVPLRDDDGIIGAVVVFRDISELAALSRNLVGLLDNAAEFIYVMDRDRRFVAASQRVADMCGRESWRELIGHRWGDFMGEEFGEMAEAGARPVIEEGKVVRGMVEPLPGADGEEGYVRSNMAPVLDRRGQIVGMIGISTEITEEKKLTDELQRTRKLTQSLMDATDAVIYVKDTEGRYILVNKEWCRVVGPSKDEAIGMTDFEIYPQETAEAIMANDRHVVDIGEPVKFEETPDEGPEPRIFISNKFPLTDSEGNIYAVGGVSTDVTQLKRQEDALREARDEAECANRAKSSFLANMSHELRTPMNAIIGYSEMLMEEMDEEGVEEYTDDLEKISSAGKHLLTLINDILDLSKIEAGRMDLYLERFELKDMLDEAVSTVTPLMAKNNLDFQAEYNDELGIVRADLTKVRQALFNLLSNAAKFTHDGQVALRAKRYEREGNDRISIEVQDNGIGIPPEKLAELFEEFTQADVSTTRKYGGTGLGLAISRRFCQMMGGDITVESEAGKGSTFTIDIPAQVDAMESARALVDDEADAVAATDSAGAGSAVAGDGDLVLVIEDDADSRKLLARILEKEGYRVALAANGQAGLDMAARLSPSVITLDVMMPGKDGWSVLRSLKADDKLRHIPVVMVTIVADKGMGYALGADDYLTKPVDRELLVHVLKKYTGQGSGRVLVVEDDEDTRDLLRRTLEQKDLSVVEAENGEQGLARFAEGAPDLVMLDLMMPVMDGFEFLARLRSSAEGRRVPVVVLTAKTLTESERKLLDGSVAQVLQKSEQWPDHVLAEIQDILQTVAAA
jgi:PAS domain S-box-containing protein